MGFGDWLAQGGFQVTGGKRDPNSRLGRANPKSWHNQGALYDQGYGAFDVRPRKDMTFDQFRQKAEADGWNVREAIDEVKNPSRHATGPHWHMAVDGRKEQQPMATSLSSLMQNNPAAMSPRQFLQRPMEDPQMQLSQAPSLASYLQAPLTNEAIQPAQMPNPSAGFVDMAPLPGVKPSTFGRGGKGWEIMGIIGDALQAAGGGRPTFMPAQMEQQQLETQGRQRLAERQADRQAALQDWMYQQQYKATNPGPEELPGDAKLLNWYSSLPDAKKAQYAAFKDVQSPLAVSGPDGRVTRVPRGFGSPQAQTQNIDGRNFVNVNGQWMEVTE
ncbi:hypothetical protein TomTYG75_07210 [Sphingobium sp. TomTYG75]